MDYKVRGSMLSELKGSGGDPLSTEDQGSVQIRAGAARLLSLSASSATVNERVRIAG
jgi:hypothetical protein